MALILTKTPMRELDPNERRYSFNEVALGYNLEEAIQEAQRCIQCKKPSCVPGCPVNVQIPQFINALAQGNVDEALKIIKQTNNLPAVCGRVCPQEEQCEKTCVLAKRGESVAIGRLERFVADYFMDQEEAADDPVPSNGKKVAVVGGDRQG